MEKKKIQDLKSGDKVLSLIGEIVYTVIWNNTANGGVIYVYDHVTNEAIYEKAMARHSTGEVCIK